MAASSPSNVEKHALKVVQSDVSLNVDVPNTKGCSNKTCNRVFGMLDMHHLCFKCRYGSNGHSCDLCAKLSDHDSRLWFKYCEENRTLQEHDKISKSYVSKNDLKLSFDEFRYSMTNELSSMMAGILARQTGGTPPQFSEKLYQHIHKLSTKLSIYKFAV